MNSLLGVEREKVRGTGYNLTLTEQAKGHGSAALAIQRALARNHWLAAVGKACGCHPLTFFLSRVSEEQVREVHLGYPVASVFQA